MATKKRGFRRVRNVFPRTVKASKGAAKKAASFFQKAKKSLKRFPAWLNHTTSKLVRKMTVRRRRH